jgi:hypothetical protein
MPRQIAYEEPIPTWLLPEPPATGEFRVIQLHDLDGVDTFTGTDDDGCVWTQFVVDAKAEQEPGTCAICGATLHSGWMNLDNGGEEVCAEHIEMIASESDNASGQFPQSDEAPLPTENELLVAIPA